MMKQIFLVVGLMGCWAASVQAATQTSAPLQTNDSDWQMLFDGQSLDGWVVRGGGATYRVESGEIVGETVPNTPNTFLCTEREFGDFVLELEFKCHSELNSGVQIRSQSLPDYKNGVVHGYQIEIDPADRAWTAGIYDESRRGWLRDLSNNRAARYAFRQNDWNHLRIEASGDRIRTWLNHTPAAEFVDSMTPSGFIGLQVHGVGGRQDRLDIRFRNIRIRTQFEPSTQFAAEQTPRPETIFDRNQPIETIGQGFRFTEGPAKCAAGKIYFSDIPNNRVHRFDPETNTLDTFIEPSGNANGLAFTAAGALIACESSGRVVSRHYEGKRSVLADSFEGKKLNSPNDVALDGVGGLYFTDPRYGERESMELDFEGVYYVNARKQITLVERTLTRPNGIILSPDYSVLYIADHAGSAIWAYDVAKPGELTNKRKIADVGSDGIAMDVHGNLYVTWGREVIVLSPGGEKLDAIGLPQNTTNCILVGQQLYVTTPTAVYRIATLTTGIQ